MIEFFRTAVGIAWDTVTYLMAWWAVPVWAVAGTVVLQRVAAGWPLERWSRSGTTAGRLAGAFLLAVARPFGRSEVRRNLERLDVQPGATAVYLVAGHGLTLYYFALLGPLLGKDVLLSHVIGMAIFVVLGAVTFRVFDELARNGSGEGEGESPPVGPDGGPRGWRQLLIGESARFVGWSLWGLVAGGLIGAAGLASSVFLVDLLPGEGALRQLVHAVVGLLAAPLSLMWPVATLFAGTFLWKIGLAQAGLIAFFCAATISPHRLSLYREAWGTERTARRALGLALSAVAAGLVVAALFAFTGLEIRYKLVPGQLWTP